jgi:predicted acylesterase/phospholipase RssA
LAVDVPSIQVAFQGGGARFVEMLPIAHALLKAHNDGTISISRVAGSSAGSICAALIACDANFGDARNFIRNEGPARAAAMRRWSSSFSNGGASPFTNRLRALIAIWHAYRGKTLLRTEVLVNFLNELFAKAAPASSRQIETINGLGGIQLLITGSDLSLSRGVVFESGNLIERIVHSSAIPFAFRTFPEVITSPYVDGGLCENLPVEQLLAKEDFDGPVFCVSIGDEKLQPYVPAGAKDYCLQLISASMNHNVDRAKRLVGLSNQFEEKTSLNTFAFEAAIAKLNDEAWYAEAFNRTMSKVHKIAQLYEMVGVPAPSKLSGRLSTSKIMHSLFKVFEKSLGMAEWEYIKSGFVVRAECLHQLLPNQTRSADYVVRIATIRAKGDNLVCFSSSAHLNDETSIIPTAWTCFNEHGCEIPVQAVPVKNPADAPDGSIGVLIFFEKSIAKGDVLTIKSHFLLDNAMEDLNKVGTDYISVSNPHSIPVANVEVVLVYPTSFGTISAVGDGTEIPMPAATIRTQYLVNLPSYSAVGMSAQNLAPNGVFRANFFRNKPYKP